MKVETYFYRDKSYWVILGEMIIYSEIGEYVLICENCGSMIVVCRTAFNVSTIVSIQVGSLTLEYYVR